MQRPVGVKAGMSPAPAQPVLDSQPTQPVNQHHILGRDDVIEAVPADRIGLAADRQTPECAAAFEESDRAIGMSLLDALGEHAARDAPAYHHETLAGSAPAACFHRGPQYSACDGFLA